MRWRQNQLLNQEGKVFSPENVLAQMYLPYLTGPEGSEQEVMEQYQKFNQLLYPLGLRIVILGMNSRGAWNIELGNGIKINVGKTNVMEKMRRLVGFIDSYLNEQIVNIESIDLRYSNGISIKKRENSSEEVVSL
jgi:cell division protein FtsQ